MSINRYKLFKNKPKANTKQINSAELARNKQKQQIYKITLENKLNQTETTNWKQIEQAIIETATETVGYKQKHQRHRVHNPEIERLSRQQKEIC
jgi:phage tail tube protein FII